MSTVVTTANTILVVLAFAAAGLVVTYAVAAFVGPHRHDPDPVENALRLYRQHQLNQLQMRYKGGDAPCVVCGEPSRGYTLNGRPIHSKCRKDAA